MIGQILELGITALATCALFYVLIYAARRIFDTLDISLFAFVAWIVAGLVILLSLIVSLGVVVYVILVYLGVPPYG